MYPAFVNCTTIDWFSEWPNDALLEVAEKYLEPMELGDEEVNYFFIFKFRVFEFYRTFVFAGDKSILRDCNKLPLK